MTKPLIADSSECEPGVFEANCGIVGLGPRDDDYRGWWPTDGYDGALYRHRDFISATEGYRPATQHFAISGHPREEWLALADAMIERWTAWRTHVAALPDDTP